MKHWLIKMPRGAGAEHETVLRNEFAYVEVVRRCGLRAVGVDNEAMLHGRMLFLPRFDRRIVSGKLVRLHQESLASLVGAVNFGAHTSLFNLVNALARVATDPKTEVAELLCRDILNLALGNTDNHARNSAVQCLPGGNVQLTPFFDFAPMYMDPEMIVRSCRWKAANGAEIQDLKSIINGIELDEAGKQGVMATVADFGRRIDGLEEIMRDCGVDAKVIEDRKPYVEAQRKRIAELHG